MLVEETLLQKLLQKKCVQLCSKTLPVLQLHYHRSTLGSVSVILPYHHRTIIHGVYIAI